MDRRLAALCVHVRGLVLDAARLAAPGLGAIGKPARGGALRSGQLLGERLLRRLFGGAGRSAGAGRLSEVAEEAGRPHFVVIRTWYRYRRVFAAVRRSGFV